MAELDHLDFIRIQGLEVSDAEVFQGVSGGDVSQSPGDGDTPMLDWGDMPEEAVSLLSQYTDDVNAWLTKIQTYDPADDTRAITDLSIPAIPLITSIVATGGASLPAVATAMAVQAVISTAGPALQNIANRFDSNSLEYIVRKAMLYKDKDGVEKSVLDDRLSDLAYVDQVIDFGAFRVHIKGKMIEY